MPIGLMVNDELAILVADDRVLGRRVAEHLLAADESLRAALAVVLAEYRSATA